MEYRKKGDLKVECIVSEEDFEFFGIGLEDLLDRTEAGMSFIRRTKELCAMTQKVNWTNIAYTLNIGMMPDGKLSLEFSECIADYIKSLKNSLIVADDKTKEPLMEFITTLENVDEENARKLVARFERNVRNTK